MPTIVHFEIPADDPERAKKFCSDLFGWEMKQAEWIIGYSPHAEKRGSEVD